MARELTKVLSTEERIENARKDGRSEIDCDFNFRFLNSVNFLYFQKFAPEPVDYRTPAYGGVN